MSLRLERALAIEAESVREDLEEVVLPIATKEEWRLHKTLCLSNEKVLLCLSGAVALPSAAGFTGAAFVLDHLEWWREALDQRGVWGGLREVTEPSVLAILAVLAVTILAGIKLLRRSMDWVLLKVQNLRYKGREILGEPSVSKVEWGTQLFLFVLILMFWVFAMWSTWQNVEAMWGKPDVFLVSSMVIAAPVVLLFALKLLDFKVVLHGIHQVFPALVRAATTSTELPSCRYCQKAVLPRPRIRRVAQTGLTHLLRWADRLPLVSSFRVQHPWVQFLSLLLGAYLIGFMLAGVAGFRFESAMAVAGLTTMGAVWRAAGSTGSSVFEELFEKMTWRRLLLFPVAVLMTVLIYGNHLFLVGTIKLLGRFAVANYSPEAMCCFLLSLEGAIIYLAWLYWTQGPRDKYKKCLKYLIGQTGVLLSALGWSWGWPLIIGSLNTVLWPKDDGSADRLAAQR